jgi:hypothetical protein
VVDECGGAVARIYGIASHGKSTHAPFAEKKNAKDAAPSKSYDVPSPRAMGAPPAKFDLILPAELPLHLFAKLNIGEHSCKQFKGTKIALLPGEKARQLGGASVV